MSPRMANSPKIVIIGAGPTGLGAGYRLNEIGHDDWVILEASDRAGGLATSYTDDAGFTYDIGGHVMFSHYAYYDELVEKLMGADYTELQREAWVWMEGRYVPYPFQNNLRHLEPETVFECVKGLIDARLSSSSPGNFAEWVRAVMGDGIAEHFMLPYNFKVWATPPELMNYIWIGERVAVVDIDAVLRNVLLGEDHLSWGPNNTFKYPLRGGTGHLFNELASYVEDNIQLNSPVVAVDPEHKHVTTADGRHWPYDVLLSTMPIDKLVGAMTGAPHAVRDATKGLLHSGSHIVGIALDRPANTTKNWIYFPEPDAPFYRVTYLSNYSPYITPQPGQTLLLTETSRSQFKEEDPETIVPRVIEGLIATNLIDESERDRIVSTWLCSPEMTYPVPSIGRDASLGVIQPWLREQSIYSRGRFGAWLYEIGNMDHSTMQGVEFVDHVLFGEHETVWIPRGES
jgi:protoporphyrinogen oxidase